MRATEETGLDTGQKKLDAFFSPKTIALIGASERPGSVGDALLRNLSSYEGSIFAINPHHTSVHGRPSFPRVGDLPEPVDLAVIATPANTVAGIIRDCGEAGIRAAIVISAGFRETGLPGIELESHCLKEARKGGVRLFGPNCIGVMVPGISLNATFGNGIASSGGIAFLSQSGALCTAALDWSLRENVGFSALVSVGSMLDVGWGELLAYFGSDPNTKTIVCYMESVGDGRCFLSAARKVSALKPVVILKVGRTAAASRAAASHTGALTGSDSVLDAAFEDGGVYRVNTLSELFNIAELSAKERHPTGPRLTIVTNAGGPGALATDALIGRGGDLAKLSEPVQLSLSRILPAHWSHANPVDILGDARASRYASVLEIAADAPETDGVLVILTPQAMSEPMETAAAVCAIAKKTDKPVFTSWMGGAMVAEAKRRLNEANIPTFDYPDEAAHAFVALWKCRAHGQFSEGAHPGSEPVSLPTPDRAMAAQILTNASAAGRIVLNGVEAAHFFTAYGFPVAEPRVALSEDAAVGVAEEIGFPVAVKLLSETFSHKSDVGGVLLNIHTAGEVREAWKRILAGVKCRVGASCFQGVSIQPMQQTEGYELILGSSYDPQFGPVILFGLGGTLVEVFRDTALGIPPLTPNLARRLMERTKVFRALRGVRGGAGVDLASLEALIVRFSELALENPCIAEAEINPLRASGAGIVALDCRIALHPAAWPQEGVQHPSPAATAARTLTPC